MALFCLGAGLQFNRGSVKVGELSGLIGIKLVLHPLITYLTFLLLGVDDRSWLLAAVLLTALPTGALAHVVALKYNTYATETAQVVVLYPTVYANGSTMDSVTVMLKYSTISI